MTTLSFVVEEAEDIAGHYEHIYDCGDVFDGDGIMDVVQSILLIEVNVVSSSIGVFLIGFMIEYRDEGETEETIVLILDFDDSLLLADELTRWR